MVIDDAGPRLRRIAGPGERRDHPDRSATAVRRVVAADLDFPNGMVITPDGATLIVAESVGRRLTAFTIDDDGDLGEPAGVRRRPRRATGRHHPRRRGRRVDVDDLAHAVRPHRRRRQVTDRIDIGDRIAIACTLGGPERRRLFLLSSTDAYPGATDRHQSCPASTPCRRHSRHRPARPRGTPPTDVRLLLRTGRSPTTRAARSSPRPIWCAAPGRRRSSTRAPVSALLVRALERCAPRDDTRLTRVVVDLMGGVPAEGDFWVSARVERAGKQIELVSAEMLAAGPDGTPPRREGQRVADADRSTPQTLLHAPAPPLRPLSEARSRDMAKDWDRNYVHSVDWRWLTAPRAEGPGESWLTPTVDLGQRANRCHRCSGCSRWPTAPMGLGSKLDIREWTFLNTDLVVHIHRVPEGEWTGIRAETNYGPDGIGDDAGHTVRRERCRWAPSSSRCWSVRGRPDARVARFAANPPGAKPLRGTGLRPGASARGRTRDVRFAGSTTLPSSCTSNTSSAIDSQMPWPVHLPRSTSTRMMSPISSGLLDVRRNAFDAVHEGAVTADRAHRTRCS